MQLTQCASTAGSERLTGRLERTPATHKGPPQRRVELLVKRECRPQEMESRADNTHTSR